MCIRLASASADQTARVWDVITGQQVCTLKGHKDAAYAVAASADGKRIATGSQDRTVKIWDASGFERAVEPAARGGQ